MELHEIRLAELIAKYLKQNITDQELTELREALPDVELEIILADFELYRERQEEALVYFEAKKEMAWNKLKTPSPQPLWKKYAEYAAVAAVLLMVALSPWYIKRFDQRVQRYNEVIADKMYGQKNDISPGKSQTIVELNNGEKVLVMDKVLKIADDDGLAAVGADVFVQPMENIRTITTPKASNIELWLPDNTKVWLNANSTLKIDQSYNKSNRVVNLKGEAFFEVAKDAHKRFMVVAESDTVAVYGTSFNVNSYGTNMAATLLEGKVRMLAKRGQQLNLPVGYQGRWRGDELVAVKVDVKKYSSWKEGFFYFKQDNLSEVLHRMADWYDIELDEALKNQKILISGTIDKKATLAEALSILQDVSGLKFTIDYRTVKITKN